MLPLLFACFRMYLRQTSASSGSIKSSKAAISTSVLVALFQVVFHCSCPPSFPNSSSHHAAHPSPLAHCLSLVEENEFCCSVSCILLSSSFCTTLIYLRCSSHRAVLTSKNSLGFSQLKVSKIARPCLFFASSKIRLKSTSESSKQGLRLLDFHLHTVTFSQVLLSSCNDHSVTRISNLVLHLD